MSVSRACDGARELGPTYEGTIQTNSSDASSSGSQPGAIHATPPLTRQTKGSASPFCPLEAMFLLHSLPCNRYFYLGVHILTINMSTNTIHNARPPWDLHVVEHRKTSAGPKNHMHSRFNYLNHA